MPDGPPHPQDEIGFILRMARALHGYGYPSHRLEGVLGTVAARLGITGQFFSTPTSIFASFGPQDDQRTFLIRVQPGEVDLGKVAQLDGTMLDVLRGALSPGEGSRRVEAIAAAPPRYGPALTIVAFGLASAAASRFLGGGMREIGVSGAIGLAIGTLAASIGGIPQFGRIFEPVAAFVASAIATALGLVVGPYSVFTATLGGLIALIPGLTLSVGLTELATRQLLAGTSRLSGAFMTFLGIAFGVTLGGRITGALLGTMPAAEPVPAPDWTAAVALVVAPLAFAVLLRAAPADTGWILASGILAVASGRLGSSLLGLELGMCVGAFAVGTLGNVVARIRNRPALITTVPGILLLVPGSIGYRSVASLLEREVVTGVETAFRMILTAVALVAGLLFAEAVSPKRPLD